MLLFRKPLADIQVGESFQVTVTREDWKRGRAESSDQSRDHTCAVAQALLARDRRSGVIVGELHAWCHGGAFRHDGWEFIRAFDRNHPFPGETVVTFTRES